MNNNIFKYFYLSCLLQERILWSPILITVQEMCLSSFNKCKITWVKCRCIHKTLVLSWLYQVQDKLLHLLWDRKDKSLAPTLATPSPSIRIITVIVTPQILLNLIVSKDKWGNLKQQFHHSLSQHYLDQLIQVLIMPSGHQGNKAPTKWCGLTIMKGKKIYFRNSIRLWEWTKWLMKTII